MNAKDGLLHVKPSGLVMTITRPVWLPRFARVSKKTTACSRFSSHTDAASKPEPRQSAVPQERLQSAQSPVMFRISLPQLSPLSSEILAQSSIVPLVGQPSLNVHCAIASSLDELRPPS